MIFACYLGSSCYNSWSQSLIAPVSAVVREVITVYAVSLIFILYYLNRGALPGRT